MNKLFLDPTKKGMKDTEKALMNHYFMWKQTKSDVTRLDGPVLFSYNGRIYAVGRYQPKIGFLTRHGSILSRKRTSIFLVEEDKLIWLSDLPSAGDTSYGGIVIKDNYLYVCYYEFYLYFYISIFKE